MTISRSPAIQRFSIPELNPADDRYFVYDRDTESTAAGPYATQAQAAFVAYFLNDDPSHVPFAPDPPTAPMLVELRLWRP